MQPLIVKKVGWKTLNFQNIQINCPIYWFFVIGILKINKITMLQLVISAAFY